MNGFLFTDVSKKINDSMNTLKQNKIDSNYCVYSNIIDLYKVFDKTYDKFNQYNNLIHLNWKGQKMNIGEIQNTLAHAVLNPSSLYFMYNNYFKFLLAAAYIEIHTFYKQTGAHDNVEKIYTFFKSWPKVFLKRFEKIINHIKTFILYNTDNNEKNIKIQDIEDQQLIVHFEELGVSMTLSNVKTDFSNTSTQKNIDKIFYFADSVNHYYVTNCVYGEWEFKIPNAEIRREVIID